MPMASPVPAARIRASLALSVAACAGWVLPAAASEEPDPVLPEIPSRVVAVGDDSGLVPSPAGGISAVVYSTLVEVPGAPWLRLGFGPTQLAGDPAANGATIRITSLLDGAEQILSAETLAQWANTSAYLNGDAVLVELIAHSGTGASRLTIGTVTAGEPASPYSGASICGANDGRVVSSEAANARYLPAGCTAWIFNDANKTFLSAGHCNIAAGGVVQFNVPLSNPDGTLVNPPPQHQYVVEPTSIQAANAGLGNDWAYFGTFANSITGLTAFQAQAQAYVLAAATPALAGQTIRITGYGTVTTPVPKKFNEVQKTDSGPYAGFAGDIVRYAADTTGGNSGSPVLNLSTGTVIGIHTNGGCTAVGGANQGLAIHDAALRAALANPRGICRSGVAPAHGAIYAVGDLNNNFGAIDEESGAFGVLAQLGPAMQGLAAQPQAGRLLGVDGARRLFALDPITGASTFLGTITGTTQTLNGLAHDPQTNTTYAIAQATGQLFRVHMSTLVATPIGPAKGNMVGALDFDTSRRALFALDDHPAGTRLLRFDPITGLYTAVGVLGAGAVDCNGLAYNPADDRLYTVSVPTGALLRVNPATGAAVAVGFTAGLFGSGYGLAAYPGPCHADFDGDGDDGTDLDIEAFFARLAGAPCPTGPCGSIDFDGDGDEGTDLDIEAFFRVIAGGPC